jgi:uncharacterized Zn-finger protein
MSKYEVQYDDNDSICPYCGDKFQVEAEDYSEDDRIVDCDECGMKYRLNEEIYVEHITRPDCTINGTNHDYQYEVIKRTGAYFCSVCGKCSLTGQDEIQSPHTTG